MTTVTSTASSGQGAARERRFALNGLSLAALEWAAGEVPVIALHGWLDNAASFAPLAPLLHNTHLLAPDLVGHGHSDHLPAAASYHLADHCRWVVALADAMGWQRFFLLGHSMGAAAASITAAAVPGRVAGLVLVDGLGPLAFTPEQEVQRLRRLFSGTPPRRKVHCFADLDRAVRVRQRLGRFPITEEAARLICERGMQEGRDGYRWRHDERLLGPSTHYYSPEQSAAILRHVACETLLLSASQGALAGWEGLASRKTCLQRLEHVELAGRHHLHMESPQAVAAVINPYLARVSREAQCCLSN
jgi:pimeloyl-ACP methyl ester carboxylesterase